MPESTDNPGVTRLDSDSDRSPISAAPTKTQATIVNAVPVRHPGRWVATGILLLLALVMAKSVVTNPRYRWGVVGEYMLSAPILAGLRLTLILTIIAQALGILIGVVLAIMRLSPNRVLSRAAWGYLWFFRGTPLLVQLIFWYNLSALYPEMSVGVPFGPTLWRGSANAIITPFAVAILGLALNEGAYMAEIVRAGIVGIDVGQSESAKALGMTHMQTLRRIVLPQAVKLIIPPTGNQTILMLKTTSLVSVLALADLLYSAQAIYARTFQTMPLLMVVSLWFLAITSVLTVGQHFLEKHFLEGLRRNDQITLGRRLARNLTMRRATMKNQLGEDVSNLG
jgi:polar amino acid transport system permease protein